VHIVDGDKLHQVGFIPSGPGTHGLYPSRDGKFLYITNRGTHRIHGKRKGKGSVDVLEFATARSSPLAIPNGGSPDMGNVSADGKSLWLAGRFDDVVYRIDTGSGDVQKVKVGGEPHGLTVWPQPGPLLAGPHRQPALIRARPACGVQCRCAGTRTGRGPSAGPRCAAAATSVPASHGSDSTAPSASATCRPRPTSPPSI
jgi:hypothetical protein